jgi:signal transduction histidine kinase
MGRGFVIAAGTVLVFALVLAYAAFSLAETEKKVLAAAEAEGRALLGAVSAGVERSIAASRAIEEITAESLLDAAAGIAEELSAAPGREELILARAVDRHRLKGAVLTDRSFSVVAIAGPPQALLPGQAPLSPRRLEPMVVRDLVRRVRERGLGREDRVVVGFGENPFGTRVEFLVARSVPESGGYLILRRDAESLRALRREKGVERLIEEAAQSEGIAYLLIEDADGRVLARAGKMPPEKGHEGRILDVALPSAIENLPGVTLRVGLDARPVETVLARGRESVALFTGVTLLFAAGAILGLTLMDRRRRRREADHARELRERERVAALGRLAAGVAHEIRSPLNAIGMGVQRLERETGDASDSAAQILSSVRREVARLNGTVEEFLSLGRPKPLSVGPVELEPLVREVVEAEAPEAAVEPPEAPVPLRADETELRKALANLVRNARQAAAGAAVAVAWRPTPEGVRIEVRDGGPGISPDERDRIFEHFVTGRDGGVGLGLVIARSAAERHGGRLEVEEAPEGGAAFVISIPAGGGT